MAGVDCPVLHRHLGLLHSQQRVLRVHLPAVVPAQLAVEEAWAWAVLQGQLLRLQQMKSCISEASLLAGYLQRAESLLYFGPEQLPGYSPC